MSTGIPRIKSEIEGAAQDLLRRLMDPACIDGEIVGAFRRGQDFVRDLDIVLLPLWDAPAKDLFGNAIPGAKQQSAVLERTLQALIKSDWLRLMSEGGCWGDRQRRVQAGAAAGVLEGMTIEIHLATKENYGNSVALWTGSEDFTTPLFAATEKGGLLPWGLVHDKGYLWLKMPTGGREKLPCRTEQDFFRRLRIDWIDPTDRDGEEIDRLRRELKIPDRGMATAR